ncbi:hypothetical protein M3Y97_00722900 [Aphelenchoides bicaudatus]|nr:hypothetical protein M3Y97_00722900 [Aphelenchoides bicaudatus]
MVKQLLSTVYQIKKVVDGPKLIEENGKKVAFYKVRWQDTFEPAYNLPKDEIDLYKSNRKRKAKVLGPIANENGHQSLQNMNFALEVDSNVQIVPYKQIKIEYKDELIAYFEKNARPLADSSNGITPSL